MMLPAIALLVAVVALGLGGYSPWASLVLMLGASGALFWIVFDVVSRTTESERARNLARKRLARKAAPGWLARWSLGRRGAFGAVEILPPGSSEEEIRAARSAENELLLFGYPFRRSGLGAVSLAITLWISFSLLPIPRAWLAVLSPRAHALRSGAEALSPEPARAFLPATLTPFFTLRDLWLLLALLVVFYAGVHAAAQPRRAIGLSRLLFFLGVLFGSWGIGQWLLGLRELLGADPSAAGLRATGPFGNRNHYALFMEMLILSGLGWAGFLWSELGKTRRRDLRQEARARLVLVGLGLVVMSLGLVFSLSRAGISFALAGCALYALLARPPRGRAAPDVLDSGGDPRTRPRGLGPSRSLYAALGLTVLAASFWIGLEPVVHRFELVPEEWQAERGRIHVWKDSWEAVEDFWLTGAGLGSFAHVYPVYRSFGGSLFYSWTHNDYLQLLVELGVPGILLLAWLGLAAGARIRRSRRALLDEAPFTSLHAGYCSAAFAVALHSFMDFGLHLPANAALFALVLGVSVGMDRSRR